MKNLIFTLALVLFTANLSFASSADFFQLDEMAMQTEMAELTALENAVKSNPTLTVETMPAQFAALNLDYSSALVPSPGFEFSDMEWGAFAWGFLCCPVGLFVVALNDDSTSNEKSSFWIGVIANVVLSGVFNGIYWSSI